MSMMLRVELLVMAIAFICVVFRTVNRKKLLLKYSLVWLLISLGLLVISVFPQIVMHLTELTGVETPSNLIFLFAIIALAVLTFSLTVIVSKQSVRIKNLTQLLSIYHYLDGEHAGAQAKDEIAENSGKENGK